VTASGGPDTKGREAMWKLVSTGSGLLGAMLAKKLLRSGYRAMRNESDPATPFDPADRRFSVLDALLWACAAGIGLGIAKVVSARVAAIGWEMATGDAPPAPD
jgi:hypothetical protein